MEKVRRLALHPPLLPRGKERRHGVSRALRLLAAVAVAVLAGFVAGLIVVDGLNNSWAAAQVASLESYRPSQVTFVYADDGETVIGEFALERRVPLRYEEIPPRVRNAILAVEDARFVDHPGIDVVRTLGAAYKNLTTGSREGGSTLTQQLAKNLFLSNDQTFERKLNEWALALQLERRYTKRQILTMYVNHIFLGANSYGVEAAANTYFGKEAKELNLEEAALLAAIPKAPSRYSPTVNPPEAKARRDLVLDLMAANGFVSREEAEAAKGRPVKLVDTAYYPPRRRATAFDSPVEEIRRYLEDKYTTRVAQGGLRVYTTINVEAQEQAVRAVRAGLRRYDRAQGRRRSDYRSIRDASADGEVTPRRLARYQHPHWYGDDYEPGEYVVGLVTAVDEKRDTAAVRFGRYAATVTAKEMGRSGRKPKDEFEVGDLPEFLIKEVDGDRRLLKVELSREPEVQGALVSLNAKTGEVVAMVGGYDFTTNKFNHATQAYRQTGSAFKPFIYAAAVEWGMAPDYVLPGAPFVRDDGRERWQPRNYDGSTGGPDVPLKVALARSLNVPAVHLLDEIGIHLGAQMVRRFGLSVPMKPYLPSALGATEAPLVEMVSAYSAFPNRGERVKPHLIRRVVGTDGRVLEEWEETTFEVTSEYVALTMVEMMRGVVTSGTATPAKSLGVPLAGKTGTVNDHTDVWFIGYTPTYVTGVWMGYPERKQSLGRGMTGARLALPVFLDFMKDFLRDKPREDFERPPNPPPSMRTLHQFREQQAEDDRERLAAEREWAKQLEELKLTEPLPEPDFEPITLPPPLPPPPPVPFDTPVAPTERRRPASAPSPVVEVPPLRMPTPGVNAGRKAEQSPRLSDGPPPPTYVPAPSSVLPKKKGKKGAVEKTRAGEGTVSSPQNRAPRDRPDDAPDERRRPEHPRATPPVGRITHNP